MVVVLVFTVLLVVVLVFTVLLVVELVVFYPLVTARSVIKTIVILFICKTDYKNVPS